jgi:hypothetical protein
MTQSSGDSFVSGFHHGFMKADSRLSFKAYQWKENLPFGFGNGFISQAMPY